MEDRNTRVEALREAIRSRIVVLDGAMGTMLQRRQLTADDFGGPELEGCNENLVLTRPDVLVDIHRAYYEAGADMVETNTFGATPLVLAEYGLADRSAEINRQAAKLARQAAQEFSRPGRPKFVAGSMGPTTKAISVTGGITFRELEENFYLQAKALVEGGADVLLVETCQDTRNTKAAIVAIHRLRDETGAPIPLMVSGTIEPMGTMLAGQAADAFTVSVAHGGLLSVGLNCATGPEFMADHIRTIHHMSSAYVSCYPNAGLPNEDGVYLETSDSLAAQIERFIDHGWLNIVGGCCGTTPDHICAIAQMAEGKKPRALPEAAGRSYYSGIELVEAEESNRPLIVGERTNMVGSKKFRELIAAEKWEEASEIARRQVRSGAQIIDVCLQSSERDEAADLPPFYEQLIRKIKTPIMIDSTDPEAVELALTYCQGKSIINSINLEDGEEKFERVCPLIRRYGAAVVVGTIDDDPVRAQAFTRERKLAVAERSYRLLTGKYGIPPEDIVIDALVFPCATGDENYIGGAAETIAALGLIKEKLPHVKTVLGISNVSFGMPAAAREVINSVFLYHATKAGLDLAIVNSEKIERFASIPEEERHLAEALLFNLPPTDAGELGDASKDWREQSPERRAAINQHHIATVAAHFRTAQRREQKTEQLRSLDERLADYIIEGSKDGLVEDLERKRDEGATPIEIINGPLMAGMNEVGRLFNNNELIVAEVLESAEVMKAAVTHLEQYMEKSAASARGKVILATVKGDVHDIGKNLVDIILSNNGYSVVNLGIKIPPEELIRAHNEHRPDAIGLSGLLVKSAQQMVATVSDLREAGISAPVLVGGAALSRKFTDTRIAPAYGAPTLYAKDAMTGLKLMNLIMDSATRDEVLTESAHGAAQPTTPSPTGRVAHGEARRSSRVRLDVAKPPLPYADLKVLDIPHLAGVWSYVNPQMLYGRHLGFRGNFEEALAARDPKALELRDSMESVKNWAVTFMKVRAVWQYFEAESEGNTVHLFAAGTDTPSHSFRFPRQDRQDGLSLADYVLPVGDGRRDSVALFVVTAGEGVRSHSEEAKQLGEYLRSHGLQALALETAEACAEWLHRRIREEWGFPDQPTMTMKDRFTARYRGKRYSFGYPACPNLADQEGVWKLLVPEEIGVELTEGYMMEPEASVSALVFHHPDCTYFSAAETTEPVKAS